MKTSVGKRLAEKLGMTFVDTDAVFEREEGASIKDTFACKGEAYFRDCETAVLATACSGNGCVISCFPIIYHSGPNEQSRRNAGGRQPAPIPGR